ncbi:hypothetical protein Pla144_49890 [Bythopirellula polymerisocia]|uniref:3-keto-alpha-glucoside-1,2-lyase/3-keto-2-hydroxy-glucal hydratase domain-containing protein n=2 Tax=Bythopirellula polymerisocia TaxID=2528003 RepID=A0A5C6C861_9BACT|nr:hypothetical protein Pla144_49890 [Bythopirellula polymerisocia]
MLINGNFAIGTEAVPSRAVVPETVLQRDYRPSPTLNASPPHDAVVLFDGSNLDGWACQKGKNWEEPGGPANWKLISGEVLEAIPGSGSIITKQRFTDFKLHLEFRVLGEKTNGGVYLLARYELNINDSYDNPDGSQCGAFTNLTKTIAPLSSMAAPPMQWQTFDIDFRAPRFDSNNVLTEKARATVALNGAIIHDDVELGNRKGAAKRFGDASSGPIMLQEHGTPYQFRNIWIVDKAR